LEGAYFCDGNCSTSHKHDDLNLNGSSNNKFLRGGNYLYLFAEGNFSLEILNLTRNISRDDNYIFFFLEINFSVEILNINSNLAMPTMTQDANYLIVIIWGRIFLRR
jgi:hypothetical protein